MLPPECGDAEKWRAAAARRLELADLAERTQPTDQLRSTDLNSDKWIEAT
jgi:hypothetical protein